MPWRPGQSPWPAGIEGDQIYQRDEGFDRSGMPLEMQSRRVATEKPVRFPSQKGWYAHWPGVGQPSKMEAGGKPRI